MYMSLFIKKNNKIFKTLIFIFSINFFIFNLSYSNEITNFEISGNERISKESIIIFSGYKSKDFLDSNDINLMLKNLYKTSFFKNVEISFDNGIVFINVVENPLIQSIIFEGIKSNSLVDQIKKIITQREKSSFVESKIKDDQNRIINSLRVNGYYFAEISSQIKENSNNTVDIIYNVNLGEKALIKNIKFIGNKVFKDNKLRKVIISEESKFWKFLSTKKNVDIQRFKLDENLLKNFYKNNGYYNVNINSSFAQIIENKYFAIVFNIDAGEKFYFNDLSLDIPIEYDEKDFKDLENVLDDLKLKVYSLNKIEKILDEIDEIALNNNYEFVSATYNEKIVENNKINLSLKLKDTEKFYIEKINISGNTITSEKVIRNNLLSDEGDPFNDILVNKSINNIRGLRIFKSVDPQIETDDKRMTKVLNINVEERPTGEIFAGAGTGTSGSSLSFGLSENNYLGEGIKLGTEFSITEKSITGNLFLNEANYKNTNRSFKRGIERSEEDYLDTFGYETKRTAFVIGTGYEQYKDIFFTPSLSNSYEEITTNSNASAAKRRQDGDYLDIYLDYGLSLNKLNQNFNPTDGYKFTFSQELPMYSEDYTLINKLDYSKYFQTDTDAIFSFSFFTASAHSISNEDARITKRIFIPSKKLRGFEPGKIGPKDGGDFIGGNFGSAVNFSTTLPNLFTEVQDLDLSLFYDLANVWGVDYDSSIDENNKIRSSTGIALDWFTPIGPLSFSYSFPITKNSNDVTEKVRFNIGTTF